VGANRVLVNGAIIPGRFQAQASKLAERPMISRPPRPWDLVRSEDAVCGAGQTPAVRRRYASLNVFSSVHFSPPGKLFQHATRTPSFSTVHHECCCATFSCPGPGQIVVLLVYGSDTSRGRRLYIHPENSECRHSNIIILPSKSRTQFSQVSTVLPLTHTRATKLPLDFLRSSPSAPAGMLCGVVGTCIA
jgi:hypothetical protein